MSFQTKIDLVLSGYSPTQIGLLTSVLNSRFNINERQVREAMGIKAPLHESFLVKGGNHQQMQRWQIDQAVQQLHQMSSVAPDYKTALGAVTNVLQTINFPGTTRAYADRLAKYLITNWDTLAQVAPVEPTGDEAEEPGVRQQLAAVPQIKKTQVGAAEPPLEQPASDTHAPLSTRSMPAQPSRGFAQNRAKAPVLGR